jgi:hypothetical protein
VRRPGKRLQDDARPGQRLECDAKPGPRMDFSSWGEVQLVCRDDLQCGNVAMWQCGNVAT